MVVTKSCLDSDKDSEKKLNPNPDSVNLVYKDQSYDTVHI